jgi:hypothetical protein
LDRGRTRFTSPRVIDVGPPRFTQTRERHASFHSPQMDDENLPSHRSMVAFTLARFTEVRASEQLRDGVGGVRLRAAKRGLLTAGSERRLSQ